MNTAERVAVIRADLHRGLGASETDTQFLLDELDRREARIETVIQERDQAREECGHEKAMRASLHREFDGWLQACGRGECFPCVESGRTEAARAFLATQTNSKSQPD